MNRRCDKINYLISLLHLYNDEIDVIDSRKAFDSIPRNELLVKLWNLGITGTLSAADFGSSRFKCVSVDINCLTPYE